LAKIVKQSVAYNFGAGLYTTFLGERVLVVVMFNATFLPKALLWKICTFFLNDAESLTTYGCALWCSHPWVECVKKKHCSARNSHYCWKDD